MNEPDQTTPPPISAITPGLVAPPEQPKSQTLKPLKWWLKKLFACNPFYLVSAMLLLYGCYRVSIDAPLLNFELSRLWFSYSSVQLYELLLVATAIFLVRRNLRYDSSVLFGVENLLVFVPFILISQASFIDSAMSWAMSLAGAALVAVRFRALKRSVFDLPGRLFGAGAVLLALNVALPLIYRHFGETKVGILDSGPAYELNEYAWLLILPAVLAMGNLLPTVGTAKNFASRERWLPVGLYALWLIATGMHVYCLDYIYQFELRPELFTPLAWVLAWSICLQLTGHPSVWVTRLRHGLTIVPILMPLLALSNIHHTYIVLAALNIIVCTGICFMAKNRRLAQHFLFTSVVMLIVGLPAHWFQFVTPELSTSACVAGGVVGYFLLLIALSRNPKLAVAGAFLIGWAVPSVLQYDGAVAWAVQGSFAFLLLHSLRWNDVDHKGAKLVRALAGVLWVMASLLWMESPSSRFWMPCIPGLLVLAAYLAVQMLSGKWRHPVIPAAAVLVTISGPGIATTNHLVSLPAGLLAVGGSFLLFGLGTVAALTRSHWHKPEPPHSGPAAIKSSPS